MISFPCWCIPGKAQGRDGVGGSTKVEELWDAFEWQIVANWRQSKLLVFMHDEYGVIYEFAGIPKQKFIQEIISQ